MSEKELIKIYEIKGYRTQEDFENRNFIISEYYNSSEKDILKIANEILLEKKLEVIKVQDVVCDFIKIIELPPQSVRYIKGL